MCLQKPAVFPPCLSSRGLGAASVQQLLYQYADLRGSLYFLLAEQTEREQRFMGGWGTPPAA